MDKQRSAMQAALEALESVKDSRWNEDSVAGRKLLADLRAALAERGHLRDATKMIGEPVAWGIIASNTGRICRVERDAEEIGEYKPEHVVPLYTAPPRRSWVGLTDEERKQFAQWVHPDVLERVEYLLKEKNHD